MFSPTAIHHPDQRPPAEAPRVQPCRSSPPRPAAPRGGRIGSSPLGCAARRRAARPSAISARRARRPARSTRRSATRPARGRRCRRAPPRSARREPRGGAVGDGPQRRRAACAPRRASRARRQRRRRSPTSIVLVGLARVAHDGRRTTAPHRRRRAPSRGASEPSGWPTLTITTPPGVEAVARELEELPRRQVERDVGLAVGVDEDRVVARASCARRNGRASAVCVCRCGRAQVEPAPADVGQLAVDLDRVDARAPGSSGRSARAVVPAALPRIATARGGAGAAGERQHEELVPVVAGQVAPGPVDRVDRLALVELQPALAVGLLDHARVLVLGLGLLRSRAPSVGRLDRADRAARAARRSPPARARPARGRSAERGDQRAARARRPGTCAGCRRAGSAAARRGTSPTSEPEVEIAYSRPATRPASSTARDASAGSAYGETAPSSSTGDGDQHAARRPASRRTRRPRRGRARRPTRRRNGPATNGTTASSAGGAEHERAQPAQRRVAVGQAPADPVADRQRDEHDRDRVRPDDRRRAEERRQQPRGGDLGAERRAPPTTNDEQARGGRRRCGAGVALRASCRLSQPSPCESDRAP